MTKKADEANSTVITGRQAAILLYLIDANADLFHWRSSQEDTKLRTEKEGRKNCLNSVYGTHKVLKNLKRRNISLVYLLMLEPEKKRIKKRQFSTIKRDLI